MTIEPIDAEGFLWIKFDKDVRLPANCTEWNSTNEGAERVLTEYKPSNDTLDYMYD